MSLTASKNTKELNLENEELKQLLLKLVSKYKCSEIKRNALLKRNAMLITDNRNLHQQLLETTKTKIISEKAVATYQEAVKLLRNQLNDLKAETSSRLDMMDSTRPPTAKTPARSDAVSQKAVQHKEESEQFFEVSGDESTHDARTFSFKSYDSMMPRSHAESYLSDDAITEAEAHKPSNGFQKDNYVMCSEVEAFYQIHNKNKKNPLGDFTNEVTKKETESLTSTITNEIKLEENDSFSEKRDRLWAQIKELKEMTKITDEELQTRRFAVAAKAEMLQDIHKEIKRMQTLVSITK